MIPAAIAAVLWAVCSVLTYGWAVAYYQRAYYQRAYPRLAQEDARSDRILAGATAVFGPFTLISWLLFRQLSATHREPTGWML